MRKFLLGLFITVWSCLGSPVSAGESETGGDNPPLFALRIHHLAQASGKVEKLLLSLNPARPIRDPLQEYVGLYLRNPGLAEVKPGSFFELLLFNSPLIRGSGWVVAIQVKDAANYQKVLSGQAGIHEESSSVELVTYRLDAPDGPEFIYLAITSSRIALFGTDREAVLLARKQYDHLGNDGLMPPKGRVGKAETNDLVFTLHLSRLLGIYEETIRTEAQKLQDDLLRDTVGESAPRNHPLALGLRAASEQFRDFLRQLDRLGGELSLNPAALTFSLRLHPILGKRFHAVIGDAPPGQPRLGAALPPESVDLHDGLLWPSLLSNVYALGKIANASFGGNAGNEVRRTLSNFIQEVEKVGPVEVASALIPPPQKNKAIGPLQLKLVRWKYPAQLPALYQKFSRLLDGGKSTQARSQPIPDFLEHNGARLKLTRQRNVRWLGQSPVDLITLQLKVPGGLKWDTDHVLTRSRRYLTLVHNDVLIIVASPLPADTKSRSRSLQKATNDYALAIMGGVVARLEGRGRGEAMSRQFAQALHFAGSEDAFAFSSWQPLEYLKLAMEARVDWTISPLIGSDVPRDRKFVQELEGVKRASARFFVSTIFRREGQDARLSTKVPTVVLQELVRAVMGIASGTEKGAVK